MAYYWCVLLAVTVIQCWTHVSGSIQGGGPICFQCSKVEHPAQCESIHECSSTEQCYVDYIIHSNGSTWYDMGCKSTEECSKLPTRRPPVNARNVDVELELCDQCCEGNLCNTKDCFHDASQKEVIRCLECENVDSPRGCTTVRTCEVGEVCVTKGMTMEGNQTFTLGCLSELICSFLNPELVGKREVSGKRSSALCEQCCAKDICNIDLCTADQIVLPTGSPIPPTTTPTQQDLATDCWELKNLYGVTLNGVHRVRTANGSIDVQCDMDTDGGGWTVFQRRLNGMVSFDKTWVEYQSFFGDPMGDFWMGNDALSLFTNSEVQTLRVDLCAASGARAYAIYSNFSIASEVDRYRLHVEEFSGTAGDSLIQGSLQKSDNEVFATADYPSPNGHGCASQYGCGWWYGDCFSANLNGPYIQGGANDTWFHGITWNTWRHQESLTVAEMKFRPKSTNIGPHQDNFICDRL